ncbi:hypothetical protein, partial [Burkholderia mallei]
SGIARAADDEMRPDHDALAAALGADALEPPDAAAAIAPAPAALRALHERPVEAELALAERLPAMMTRLVADLAATELVPG